MPSRKDSTGEKRKSKERETHKLDNEYSFEYIERLSDDFFNKRINEAFAKKVLCSIFSVNDVRDGDPVQFEPDIFLNNVPFEITLVSDRKKQRSFIQRLKNSRKNGFESDDIGEELLSMIAESIMDKASKKYSVPMPYLCLIVPIPMMEWLGKGYGSIIEDLFITRHAYCFHKLKEIFINRDIFSNIFLLVPSLDGTWWCIDMKTDLMIQYRGDFNDPSYPYYMEIEEYTRLKQDGVII